MGRALLRDEVPVGPCKVRALYSWSGESPQDLGFVEGDIIEVLNNGDGDWWTGKLKRNKLVGIFPRNFAEYVDENQKTMSAARSSAPIRKKHEEFVLETLDLDANSISNLQINEPSELDIQPSSPVVDVKPGVKIQGKIGESSLSQSTEERKQDMKDRKLVPLNAAFSSSLSSSRGSAKLGSSVASTKSTKEILDDVGAELNKGFLDDINLDVNPEDLRTPELETGEFPSLKQSFEKPAKAKESRSPVPPPHTVSLNSSLSSRKSNRSRSQSLVPTTPITDEHKPEPPVNMSSALTGPLLSKGVTPGLGIGNGIYTDGDIVKKPAPVASPANSHISGFKSPEIRGGSHQGSPQLDEEVPFDPSSFQAGKAKIPDHIGSHFDNAAYSSQLGKSASKLVNSPVPSETPVNNDVLVSKTRVAAKSAAPSSTVYYPQPVESEKKPNFFQRLFPKNSEMKRSLSRTSQKSTKSVTSRLKNKTKSIFSMFESEDSLYPSNMFHHKSASISKPSSPVISTPVTSGADLSSSNGLKPITTPPRNNKVTSTFDTTSKMKSNALGSSINSNRSSTLMSNVSAGPLASKEAVGGKWIETRRDLYRAQTLTERDMKKRRQELELQGINCDNLVEHLNDISADGFHDYRLESFESVDQAVLTMSTWPQLMTPSVFSSSRIGRHFQDPVERIRAVFLLCATRISHVSHSPQPNNVMQSRVATPSELAATVADMCTAVDIECIAVDGHIRSAGINSKQITSTPHSWNAVKINKEWRFLDAVAAASGISNGGNGMGGEEDDDEMVDLFYFLTPPSQLIFSHVPNSLHHQFYQPPLATASAALLPLASPSAFAHNIMFKEFWLGLTRVSELDVSELTLKVPDCSKDVVALVDGESRYALSQAFFDESGQRMFRIKSFIPQHNKQSVLQLFVVPKSQSDRTATAMELLWTMELRHSGGGKNNAPFEFIGRYATPSTSIYDFYVQEPQCRSLGGGDLYNFKVNSFDASEFTGTKQPKVAIQSPSGRLTRMVPFGTDVTDTFKTSVKTLEVGTWRAVARKDDKDSWVPFAEWFCS